MRKSYLLLIALCLQLATYAQNYTVLGNASSLGGCNCFRLTPDADDQAGAIFQNQTINLNNSFDFTFNVFLGCNGANGADGIVFVLTSNPNGLGNQGEGLGYAGGNQPFSFAVEFDTWQNGSVNDPSYDHIAIESGGQYNHNVAPPVSALTSQGNIDDCNWHTVRIVWDVNSNTYSVYFDGVLRQQVVIPNMVSTYFGGNPVVNWGWSGATGGGSNDQQVCVLNTSNWVAGVNYQSCNLTMQFNDISTSSLGSVQSWAWTFGDGATSTQQNPTHTYASLGTYTVTLTITDISGCTNTYTHSVTINPPIVPSAVLLPPPCNGGSNGNINMTATGGFGPAAGYGGYMFNWSNNTSGTSLVGVVAGTYTVTATDGVCITTAQYTLNQPPPLTATTSHTDAPCGNPNGTATITGLGGTPPYNVNWAGFAATSGVALSMPVGTWIADLHDANGCSSLLQYRETIAALPCGINASASSTNVTCFGGTNGTATLTVSGNTGTPTIIWNPGNINGSNGVPVTGLSAGTYTYNYSDADPAHAFSGSVVITQPGAAMTASISTVNTSCAGTNDGQAIVSVSSGGVSPYSYSWNRGSPNGAVDTALSPGAVSVVVTDANGCVASASGLITGPPALTLNVTSVDDSCYQSRKGSATANVNGGNAPYLFYWSNISSAQTDLSLGIGTYTVTVTDDKGCTITGSATINQAPPFSHTLTSTNILCNGASTGSITVTPNGGTPGYTYIWNPSSASGSNPSGLAAGQYNVTVRDANNCERLDSVVITQPATALTVTSSHTDVNCNGGSDGTITVNLSGGTPPYTYNGLPAPPGSTTIPGLAAGTYTGTVTDANGCTATASETISEPGPQSLDTSNVIDNICNGGNSGSITVNFVNATGTVTYNWNPGGVQPATRNGLAAGVYNITATDQRGCTVTNSVTVNEPAAPVMSVTVVDATCFGGNGSATAQPVGGGTFNYFWSASPSTAQTITAPAGNYTVTATDANSCIQSASFTINQPTAITIAETHTDPLCFGSSNGTITLTPSGGLGPNYTYAWNPNVSTTNTANSLAAGSYVITVTDQASCNKIDTVVLTDPPQLTLNIQPSQIPCYGMNNGAITIIATGGTGGYIYTWNPNVSTTNSATGLAPNNYVVTVADANGCSVVPTISITEPNQPLTLVKDSSNLTCYQSNNGMATVTASGGTNPYSYLWTTAGTTNTINSLAAGSYAVTVTDINQCTSIATYNITQPALLTLSETHVNVLCNGNSTGSVHVTAAGGTTPYSYTWSPNVSSTDSAVNLPANTYNVIVSDSNNCTATVTAVVTEPAFFIMNPTVTNVLCNGQSNGAIDTRATGGTPAYNFSASDGTNSYNSTTGIFNSLAAGNYSITATDQNACMTSIAVTVSEPPLLTATVDTIPAKCYNSSDGQIVVSPNGGTSPYNISLSNGMSNPSGIFSGLPEGTYAVTVVDSNGCQVNDNAFITQPDSIYITVSPSPVEVKLGDVLQLSTSTNYTGQLTYNWTPSQGLSCSDCANPEFSGVYSQRYDLVVTTLDGCRGTSDFVVTVIPNYEIFIPNVFTPDGNGENDDWQIFGNMSAIKQLDVNVFNRWGEKVYEAHDINFKWDGTYKSEKVPPGVYVYTAKFVWLNNHSDNRYTGSITVLH